MKKLNLWLFMSLFVAAFTLSACGDDDNDKPADTNPLLGRWESKVPLDLGDVKVSYAFTIGADKSVKFEYRMRNNDGVLHNGYNRYGTYVEDGKKITVNYVKFERVSDNKDTFDQPEQFVYTYRIENNRLFISGDDDSNGQVLQNFEFVKK
jgi:hypothetical protein